MPRWPAALSWPGRLLSRLFASKAADRLYDLIGAGLPANETVPASLGMFFACPNDVLGAILTAANAGGDTDSTASMAGALAACTAEPAIFLRTPGHD